MLYRDDLYQANRRVTELEAQLIEARANRDQLAGALERPARAPEPEPSAPRDPEIVATPAAHEWWPALVALLGTVLYFGYFRARLDEFDLPLGVIIPSVIVGSGLYSLDVVMRYFNGNRRTVWCRLAMVLGAIAGGPALLVGFLALGGLMGIVGPIVGVIVVVCMVIGWIARGD